VNNEPAMRLVYARALKAATLGESPQPHFSVTNQIPTLMPTLVEASGVKEYGKEILSALCDAESAASSALTMGDGTKQDILDIISNGLKNYRLTLPLDVRQLFLSLAESTKNANSRETNLLKETVEHFTPSTLCGWILVDALRKKDFHLLKAACTLGIDSFALDSFTIPLSKERGLKDLREAIKRLL
jgi:hypothetical protein